MNSILQDLAHPPTRHAMLVHLPIVLAMIGIPLTFLAAVLPRNWTLKWLTIALYAVLVVMSFITSNSGMATHNFIDQVDTPEIYELIERHDSMGSNLWWFAAGTLAMLALSATKGKTIKIAAAWLSVAGAVSASIWVGLAANLGGKLVYTYGIGTPNPVKGERAATQAATTTSTPTDATSTFETTVWPILADNCTKCHNPVRVADGKSGRLDQTTREAMLKGGKSGPAIVPGKPEESLLISLIKTNNVDQRMPPDPRDPLTPAQIATLGQWIREGAVWNSGSEPTSN